MLKKFDKRPSLKQQVADKKKDKKKNEAVKFSGFLVDVKNNPMILIGLSGSALFTSLAGVFLGIAPHRDGNIVTFFNGSTSPWVIAFGLFFGLLYAVTFPLLGEWGVYYWHKKASLRDDNNPHQTWSAYGMLGLTALFMVITAIFASTILASLLGAFEVYAKIPEAAQKWTVTIIPIGLALHAFANIYYDHNSAAAAERRILEAHLLSTRIESEGRIRAAQVEAEEKAAIAFADEYESISSAEAVEAGKQKAKRHWNEHRQNLGAEESMEEDTPERERWTLEKFMVFQKSYQENQNFSVQDLSELFGKYPTADDAWRAFQLGQGIPSGMLRKEFAAIFNGLLVATPTPQPIPHSDNGKGTANP